MSNENHSVYRLIPKLVQTGRQTFHLWRNIYSPVEDLQNGQEGKFKASLCKNNSSFHIQCWYWEKKVLYFYCATGITGIPQLMILMVRRISVVNHDGTHMTRPGCTTFLRWLLSESMCSYGCFLLETSQKGSKLAKKYHKSKSMTTEHCNQP